MGQNEKNKSLIKGFLQILPQRGYITKPGAAPQVNRHISLDHRAINHQKHKTVSDGCSPALINAQFLLTGFGELPLDVA